MTALDAVHARLRTLPAKVSVPFRDLLSTGLLKPETAQSVLDAGESAGEPQHILGFAIAFLEMERAGVPVADTIRMARLHGRRLNLRWSPKRWQKEHGHLSRLSTLRRLEAKNEVYDLDAYERLLPERWPGYLIRTSRRLGLEGLRQNHCVAAYHGQIKSGYAAIATVFVDRTRWTVELTRAYATGELRLAQIRGRHNRTPGPAVRRAICVTLGIEPTAADPYSAANRPAAHSYMENLRRVLPVLRERNVDRVEVSFSGCGDSGQIDDVTFLPAGYDPVRPGTTPAIPRSEFTGIVVASETATFVLEDGEWTRQEQVEHVGVEAAIATLTEDYLQETGVDWYNNTGGHGCLEIDVPSGTVNLEVNQNEEVSNLAFARLSDIVSGEPIEERAA